MKIRLFKYFIVVFWLLMTAWLLRIEAFPEKFTETIEGYRALLRRGPMIVDSWLQIEQENSPIGYTHTWVDTSLESDDAAWTVRNQSILNFNIMGQEQWVGMNAEAVLDGQYRLRKFSAAMTSRLYSTRIDADRIRRNLFQVRIQTPAMTRNIRMEIPEDVVVYSPMIEMAMKRLHPGQCLKLKTVDPLTLTVADVIIKAVRREKLSLDGKQHDATMLTIEYQGLKANSWIDDKGRILRQETPFGWVMRASTPREIMSRRRQSVKSDDLLASMTAPCSGNTTDLRNSVKLKARLNGPNIDMEALASHRQLVGERRDGSCVVTLMAQEQPKIVLKLDDPLLSAPSAFLGSSAAIQSDDGAIREMARQIMENCKDAFDAAQAIYEWVYLNIAKTPAISLPSALDVLKQREGDCNEHTYLFVALARAAGLPAQINVGLVYAEREDGKGAFYYHAWPAVFVGEWIEMDPTLGVPLVDATYICLAAGEIGAQMKLLGLIGRISVDIIETTR